MIVTREWRLACASLAAMAEVTVWLAILVHFEYAGAWTALFCTGDQQRIPAELAPSTYRWKGVTGYDGQYYRYVAHDPLLRKGYVQFVDAPLLRYRRILLP